MKPRGMSFSIRVERAESPDTDTWVNAKTRVLRTVTNMASSDAYRSWLASFERALRGEARGAVPPTYRWRFYEGVERVLLQSSKNSPDAVHRHYRWWIETPETPPVPWRRWLEEADPSVAAGVAAAAAVFARATDPSRPTLGAVPEPPPSVGNYAEEVTAETAGLFSEIAAQISCRWRPLPPIPDAAQARDELARYLEEVAERRRHPFWPDDPLPDEQAASNAKGLEATAQVVRDLPPADDRLQALAEIMANRNNVLLVFGECENLLLVPEDGQPGDLLDTWLTKLVNAQRAGWEAEVAADAEEQGAVGPE